MGTVILAILSAAADPGPNPPCANRSSSPPLTLRFVRGVAPTEDACRSFLEIAQPVADPDARALRAMEGRLQKTGLFRQVRCRRDESGAVACTLAPHTLVRSVDLDGAPFPLLDTELGRRLGVRRGTVWRGKASARETQERLRRHLQRHGFFAAQVEVDATPADPSPPHLTVDVRVRVEEAEDYVLGEVDVIGDTGVLDRAEAEDYLSHYWLPFVWPRRLSPEQLDEDVRELERQLRDEGYPEARIDESYAVDPRAEALDVVLDVDAGPRLRIQITGNHAIDDEELTEALTFANSGVADEIELRAGADAIRTAYRRDGYYAAQVEATLERPEVDEVIAQYAVEEGPQAEVVELSLRGTEALSEAELLDAVAWKLEPNGWFGDTYWSESLAAVDSAALRDYYRQAGLPDAEVTASYEVLAPGELAAVYDIREGLRRRVGMVRLEGLSGILPEAEARAVMKLDVGAPFTEEALEADRRYLAAALAEAGYLDGEIHVSVGGTPETTEITFRLERGPRHYFGDVLVRGNFDTAQGWIEDQVDLDRGDVVDATAVANAALRLRRSGLFASVQVERVPDAHAGRSWIGIQLQEIEPLSLDLLASFSSDDLFAVGMDLRHRNLFGYALELALEASFANASEWGVPELRIGNRDDLRASLQARRPFRAPFDTTLSLFYVREDKDVFEQTTLGGYVSLSRQLLGPEACTGCPALLLETGYRLDVSDFLVRSGAEVSDLPPEMVDTGRLFVGVGLWDLDALVDPRRGWRLQSRGELALAALSPREGATFWRVLLSAVGYLPLGVPFTLANDAEGPRVGPVVVAGTVQLAHGGAFGESERLPAIDAFSYGGDYSLRGAKARASAAAHPYAAHLWLAQLELRWYFLENTGFGGFQIAGLTDAATVADEPAGLFDEVTVSSGLALRYVTPVGLLSLAYAWPWLRAASVVEADPSVLPSAGRVHFGLGGRF